MLDSLPLNNMIPRGLSVQINSNIHDFISNYRIEKTIGTEYCKHTKFKDSEIIILEKEKKRCLIIEERFLLDFYNENPEILSSDVKILIILLIPRGSVSSTIKTIFTSNNIALMKYQMFKPMNEFGKTLMEFKTDPEFRHWFSDLSYDIMKELIVAMIIKFLLG